MLDTRGAGGSSVGLANGPRAAHSPRGLEGFCSYCRLGSDSTHPSGQGDPAPSPLLKKRSGPSPLPEDTHGLSPFPQGTPDLSPLLKWIPGPPSPQGDVWPTSLSPKGCLPLPPPTGGRLALEEAGQHPSPH